MLLVTDVQQVITATALPVQEEQFPAFTAPGHQPKAKVLVLLALPVATAALEELVPQSSAHQDPTALRAPPCQNLVLQVASVQLQRAPALRTARRVSALASNLPLLLRPKGPTPRLVIVTSGLPLAKLSL